MSSASGTSGQPHSAASTPPKASETAPKVLGKYALRKKIGVGGMGAVFLADDTELKRPVALKMLPKEKAANPTLVRRFKAEAQAAAQLRHDNIVTVYEAGEAAGYLFIALEYIDGTDVFKLVSSRGVLPVRRTLKIVQQVARALQHAHQRNIVHRDIKPSNLMIQRDGTVKLTDMGLARTIDDETETGITRPGMTVGTVDYMSPEQASDSKAADIRSDIYSLGCTWYHMLTGKPPFAEGSVTNKLNRHASDMRPDPREVNESIPDSVVETLHRMMAVEPADRQQTPTELLADLETIDPREVSPSDKLLEAISDTETDHEIKAARTVATDDKPAPRLRKKKVKVPGADDADRGWIKYALGFGALAALALLVIWITSSLGRVFDGGGVVVARGGAPVEAEGAANGSPSAGGGDEGGRRTPLVAPQRNPFDTGSGASGTSSTGSTRQNPGTGGLAVPRTTDPQVLEAIPIGRQGEKEYLPAWVADVPEPDRPAGAARTAKLTMVTVGRLDGGPAQFASLNAAIEGLPANGGVIQLIGDGPFTLDPVQFDGKGDIVIAGEPRHRPVVALQPDVDDAARPVVALSGGSLSLLNVQLAAVAKRFGQEAPVTLFDLRGGELSLRGCSLTLLGRREGRTVAFRTSDAAPADADAAPAMLLLDRLFVRGDSLTAVAIGGAPCDVVSSNSLFATGAAPIVEFSGSSRIQANAGKKRRRRRNKEPTVERTLRMISTTGVASGAAFTFAPGTEGGALPSTAILTLNSLLAAPKGADRSVLASLGNWPRQQAPEKGHSTFQNLTWTVQSSISLGWGAFLKHDGNPPLEVTDIHQWRNAWNQLVGSARFLNRLSWPAAPFDHPAADAALFEASTTGVSGLAATDGGLPGCQVADLATPAAEILRRVDALSERPIVPEDMFASNPPIRTVNIDLDKGEDLGRIVSSDEYRSGTLFVASGAGSQRSTPIRVRGKSVRVEFRQTRGLPLQILPREVNAKEVDGTIEDSFISVADGGRIEIAHANIRIPNSTSDRRPNARWLMVAQDGSFLFDDCYIQGPAVAGTRSEGFIRWQRPAEAEVEPQPAGRYQEFGEIRNCYFKGIDTMFKLDAAERALIVRNSVLMGANELFDLTLAAADRRIHAAIDIEHSTVAANRTFFKLRAAPINEPAAAPLYFFVDHTIFAPPAGRRSADRGAVLLAYNNAFVRTERQIEWWGLGNAYTDQLKKYIDGPAAPEDPGDFDAGWSSAWDAAACLRPLSGSGAVAFKLPAATVSKATPAHFALHPSSKATAWTADGKPIGADAGSLGDVGPQSETRRRPTRTKPKGPRKPGF